MTSPRLPLLIILALVPLAVAFRYLVRQEESAKLIGTKLATAKFLAVEENGYEVAVSPPETNKWFFLSLALIIGGVEWLWLAFGWRYGLIGVVAAYGAALVAQMAFLPEANSRYFVLSILGSMSRRRADYVRDGDTERAEAMSYLLRRFMTEYESVIAKREKP
jgi:hypothetical protein